MSTYQFIYTFIYFRCTKPHLINWPYYAQSHLKTVDILCGNNRKIKSSQRTAEEVVIHHRI